MQRASAFAVRALAFSRRAWAACVSADVQARVREPREAPSRWAAFFADEAGVVGALVAVGTVGKGEPNSRAVAEAMVAPEAPFEHRRRCWRDAEPGVAGAEAGVAGERSEERGEPPVAGAG